MKSAIGSVIVGPICTDQEIEELSSRLAVSFAKAKWKWSVGDGSQKVPDAATIADSIRHDKSKIRTENDWCMSGGLAVVCHAGQFRLEVHPDLVPASGSLSGK